MIVSSPIAVVQIAEAAALKATKEFGATSPEARLAWDTYEEVAAADNTIATRVTLDEDCDVSFPSSLRSSRLVRFHVVILSPLLALILWSRSIRCLLLKCSVVYCKKVGDFSCRRRSLRWRIFRSVLSRWCRRLPSVVPR